MQTKPADFEIETLVQHVQYVAQRDYDKAGWDILVECCSDTEIREAIGNAWTERGAERAVWVKLVRPHYLARREVQGHAF